MMVDEHRQKTETEKWAESLNQAIGRHALTLKESSNVRAVLLIKGIRGDDYDAWIAGKKSPDKAMHEKLLKAISNGNSQDELDDLRTKRQAIIDVQYPEKIREQATKARNRSPYRQTEPSASLVLRAAREPEALRKLRRHPAEQPYERLTDPQRWAMMGKTLSAPEYLTCYRLNLHLTREAAATQMQTDSSVLRHSENGKELPTTESLERMKKGLFKNPSYAQEYEKRVYVNRRILLHDGIENGCSNYELASRLKCWPKDLARQELMEFAQPAAASRVKEWKEEPGNLIVSHDLYLKFVRQALGLTQSDAAEGLGINKRTLIAVESNSERSWAHKKIPALRDRIKTHLESIMREQDPALYRLLSDPEVQERINALPVHHTQAEYSRKEGMGRY